MRLLLSFWLLLAASSLENALAKDAVTAGTGQRQLKRSNAKRWDNMHEVIRSEIKSATRKFLQERARAITLPIQVDILLLGFDGDGGYGYKLERRDLEELLGTATGDNTICPTVWETGEPSAVCLSVNYLTLDDKRIKTPLERIENVLKRNMEWVGDRSQDWPDGSREVQVYEVEANGEVEATIWDLLDEAYGGAHPEVNREQHSQIVIINPSKLRMRASLPRPGGAAELEQPTHEAPHDFMAEWKKGNVNSSHVVDQEGGYLYRYRYNGRGAAASFVGQYNYVLLDVSAGPVSYGPLSSPSGAVAPTAMPRLMPMLLRMTRELESSAQVGTLHEMMMQQAVSGQAALLTGQLASAVAGATRQLFASDVLLGSTDVLADGAKRVVVPIIVLQDHMRELESEGDGGRWVDVDMVQLALDELLPPDVYGAVSVSRHMLHHHKQLATALVKARHSRSEAVLAEPPDVGLHKSQSIALDSAVLLRELRLAQDELVGAAAQHLNDDYSNSLGYGEGAVDNLEEALTVKHRDTKVIPVFVFSLERSPEQMMFDNHQLVAAGHDVVMVLQLLGSPQVDDFARGRVYSGHMQEGHHLLVDAAEAPTRHIVAGLATALGGIVPVHQRYCQVEKAVVEDWRWSVGAVPWGPYSNYTALSSIFAASAHRNLIVGRIEAPLRRLTATMDRIDAFIGRHLLGPFAFLRKGFADHRAVKGAGLEGVSGDAGASFAEMLPHHHLLDDLAQQHRLYHNASAASSLMDRLSGAAGGKAKKGAPANASVPHPPSTEHDSSHQVEDEEDDEEDEEDEEYEPAHRPPAAEDEAGRGALGAQLDLVEEQPVLSPKVAQRLQRSLVEIGTALEQISYLLYSRNWAELEDALPHLSAAVQAFAATAERDLTRAAEVVGCCSVRHVPAGSSAWFVVGLLVVVLGGFAILAYVALRSRRSYRASRLHLSRENSLSRGRSLSGQLPTWSGPTSPIPR